MIMSSTYIIKDVTFPKRRMRATCLCDRYTSQQFGTIVDGLNRPT
jgi:hypothetical protein